MNLVFLVCAAIGGTILVVQFILSVIGLGDLGFDADTPMDIPDDLGVDVPLDADLDADFNAEIHGDVAVHDLGDAGIHYGSSWLFGVLSFRTIVAALAFFGLGGLAARAALLTPVQSLGVAIGCGALAMAAVYWMMRALRNLRAEGTVRIRGAVGQHGEVYLRVPGNHAGNGKIQLNLQNRTVEYQATTAGHDLPTGTKVVVLGVVDAATLEVAPVE